MGQWATSAIFQLYYDENKLFLNDDHDEVRFVLDQHTELDYQSIVGVMVHVITSSALDCGLEPRSGQTID
jgi:hypothetical protein